MNKWTPERIKALRKRLNLYQREIAPLLGVTREYIINLEKGVKRPGKTLELLLDCVERQSKQKRK